VPKSAYHHGNLREDVLDASLARVRAGGMSALLAREVAREVGVTPAAVYRHFADVDHLRAEVSRAARQELARTMQARCDAVPDSGDRRALALARFEATGIAYVQFAHDEPGLFDAAFTRSSAMPSAPDDPSAWAVLNSALDALVAVGALSGERRGEAPMIAWTSVHGLACIVAFSALPPDLPVAAAIRVVLDGIDRALGLP
jgi:AcrR family transcriptional regulator